MKKLLTFVLVLLLFCSPLGLLAEEIKIMNQEKIAEAPAIERMTEKQLNDLFGEEMYLGETDWRGNKVSTKRNYSKKENR